MNLKINKKQSNYDDKSMDIENLRSDILLVCKDCLENVMQITKDMPITNILNLATVADMKGIQKTLVIHEEFVRWLQKQMSLVAKSSTIDELSSIYNQISTGLAAKSSLLDGVLREAIEDSSFSLRKKSQQMIFKNDT